MITPSFALTATERVLPRLALDFTTASLDSRVTFTRSGNTATVTNSSGTIVGINANLPRFDYNPTTLVCNGLLIEEARTNLLLNSLINGTVLSTQVVTTTAVATTLSFYGTGQVVLSGTSSATVVGTGAYPARTTYTFTPTAGVLTLTVTGTVQYAQLEVGAFATSFIPTAATSVARSADIASMTGTNFSSWYNTTEGTFVGTVILNNVASAVNAFGIATAVITSSDAIGIGISSSGGSTATVIRYNNISQITFSAPVSTTGTHKVALAYKLNSAAASTDASTVLTTSSCTIPSVTQLNIGQNRAGTVAGSLYISKLAFYNQRLINAEVQSFSK